MTARVVIVGASLGGLRTAETLRAKGFEGEIVLVGAEEHPPYNRPPLSKEVLRGEADHESLAFKPSRPLDPVEWRLGRTAVAADLTARTVTLDDGNTLDYDVLVVATGVRPRHLPSLGGKAGVFSLRDVSDAKALGAVLRPGAHLTVIGSGFVGCEVAASARKLGVEVDVVTMEAAPLAAAIGPQLASVLFERHLENGVTFHLEDGLAGYDPDAHEVTLSSGTRLRSDAVLEAIGSAPNVEWLDGNGLDLSDGLHCDDTLAVVGADGVYAVGDVARFPNARFDDAARPVEHWNVAVETGRRAAAAHARRQSRGAVELPAFRPMPTFWSNQYDIRLQAYGMTRLADTVEALDEELGGAPIMAYRRDGDLVAVAALTNGPRLLELSREIGTVAAVG